MLRGCAADVPATRRLSSNLTSYLQGFRHTTKGGHLRPRQCINSRIACFPQRTPFQQLNENVIYNGAVDEPKKLIHAILIADLIPASLSTVHEKFRLIITPTPGTSSSSQTSAHGPLRSTSRSGRQPLATMASLTTSPHHHRCRHT